MTTAIVSAIWFVLAYGAIAASVIGILRESRNPEIESAPRWDE